MNLVIKWLVVEALHQPATQKYEQFVFWDIDNC